jgi:hypothetical protein
VNGLTQRHQDCARAAGALVSRTPECLSLLERIYTAYRELPDCRLALVEIRHLVWLDDTASRFADNDQHSDGSRRSGHWLYAVKPMV